MSAHDKPSSLRDHLRRIGLTQGPQDMAETAASARRVCEALEAIRKALDGVEGLTPVERRQALITLAGFETLSGVFMQQSEKTPK